MATGLKNAAEMEFPELNGNPALVLKGRVGVNPMSDFDDQKGANVTSCFPSSSQPFW